MKLQVLKMLAGVLLIASSACQGTTFTVLAGTSQNGFVFSPKDTPINSGDTVVFKYNAGPMHNVVADDNSFNSGAPSTGWTFTQTFTNTGTAPQTIPFHCAVHGGPNGVGMAGTITVAPAVVTPSIKLGGYLSGNWSNPTAGQGGHGFQFEFTDTIDSTSQKPLMVAIWFVYTPTGTTASDGSGQNWIIASGPYDPTSNTVTLTGLLLAGAKFPPAFNFSDLKAISGDGSGHWGTLTFTFSDCNNGTASWTSTMPAYGNSSAPIPIQRNTKIAGTACPQ